MKNLKKYIKLWITTLMVSSLTLFVAIATIMGSDDIVIIGAAYIAALLLMIIPAALFSFLVLFATPYIKHKTLRFSIELILGAFLLGPNLLLAIMNTFLVGALRDADDIPVEIPEPIKYTKTFRVYDNEIVGKPMVCGPEQLILGILKEKGAPVSGTIYFKLDEGYEMTMFHVPHKNCRVYQFTK